MRKYIHPFSDTCLELSHGVSSFSREALTSFSPTALCSSSRGMLKRYQASWETYSLQRGFIRLLPMQRSSNSTPMTKPLTLSLVGTETKQPDRTIPTSQSRAIVPDAHAMLPRHVNQNNFTTSGAFRNSSRISSAPLTVPLRSFLTLMQYF